MDRDTLNKLAQSCYALIDSSFSDECTCAVPMSVFTKKESVVSKTLTSLQNTDGTVTELMNECLYSDVFKKELC